MFGIDAADRINGRGGDDIISGGMANDRLTQHFDFVRRRPGNCAVGRETRGDRRRRLWDVRSPLAVGEVDRLLLRSRRLCVKHLAVCVSLGRVMPLEMNSIHEAARSKGEIYRKPKGASFFWLRNSGEPLINYAQPMA